MTSTTPEKELAPKKPVIITNGFSPIPMSVEHLALVYRAAGFQVRIIEYRLEDMMDIKRYAKHIARTARELHESTGHKAHIVGISMGGVAALFGIKFYAAAPVVDTLVAMGSPFKGTPATFLGEWTLLFHKTGRQLAFRSEFIQKLHEDPLPPGPRYVSVSGHLDFVCPPYVSQLDGTDNRFLLFQHFHLILSPLLHQQIANILLE
ncbi:MAG: hypothetical protein U9Q03_06010 [Patescibacteria group bacterium]|nr:hypothetical protein [Patescibacteria group bacterium]